MTAKMIMKMKKSPKKKKKSRKVEEKGKTQSLLGPPTKEWDQ